MSIKSFFVVLLSAATPPQATPIPKPGIPAEAIAQDQRASVKRENLLSFLLNETTRAAPKRRMQATNSSGTDPGLSSTSSTSSAPSSSSAASSRATEEKVPDSNAPFMKDVPEYNSNVFKAGDKQQYQEYTGSQPPPQDVVLPNNDVLNFDQRNDRSTVRLTLNGNDKLVVDTLPSGAVAVDFWSSAAGTQLNVFTDVDGTLEMNVTNSQGSPFTFKSQGQNFTIPQIEFDSAGAFRFKDAAAETPTFSQYYFSKYLRTDNTANLQIPSLGLDINFNIFDLGCGHDDRASESEMNQNSTETSTIKTDVATYNYVEHGRDWADQYPDCGLEQQSPINLLPVKTKYGQSYEIFTFQEDKLRPEYWDLEDAAVEFHKSIYSVEVYIDHNHGYAGFESLLGNSLFGAPSKWDAVEFIFHHGSEHLINGERFDLEMQIIHKEHISEVENVDDGVFGRPKGRMLHTDDEPAVTNRRHLASTSGSEKSSEEEKDYFRYAIVSILFSTHNYSTDIDPVVLEEFETFFEELNFEQDDHVSPKITFGNLMEHIDWSHRWIYKGSLSVPPCSQFVYWNIIGTVYPIQESIVEAFKKKLKGAGVDIGEKGGNYREVQLGLNLDVYYVQSGASWIKGSSMVSAILAMAALLTVAAG